MTRRASAALVAALAFASGAFGGLAACAGEDAARPPPVPPPTSAPPGNDGFSRAGNGDSTRISTPASRSDGGAIADMPFDAAPPPRAPLPEPAYGSTESAKPGDVHPFRLAAALRAMRASPSAAKVVRMLAALPSVKEMKTQTGVDPLADGEWLLVYGTQVALPGPNANVLRHGGKPDVADAGPVEMFGVRDVLLRPQAGVLALVPSDRARDLGAALAKPIDPGVKPGELARMYLAEPAKVLRALPPEVVHATLLVKPGADGGLDFSADADCGDAASCKTIAASLEELVRRQNGMLVRLVIGNVLGSFTASVIDGPKLRATLHAKPEHVDAALVFLRSEIGLPAETADAGAGSP